MYLDCAALRCMMMLLLFRVLFHVEEEVEDEDEEELGATNAVVPAVAVAVVTTSFLWTAVTVHRFQVLFPGHMRSRTSPI